MKFNIFPLLLLIMCFGCSNPQSTAEKFFNKIAVDQDFDGAYEMLTARTKEKLSKEAFSKEVKDLLANPKYGDLYKYEAKRREFKIVKSEKNGSLMETFFVTYRTIERTADFFSLYEHRSKDIKSTDPEKLFDDKFLVEYRSSFFDEQRKRLTVIKEDGEWKVEIRGSRDIISDFGAMKSWFNNNERVKAAARAEEKFQNSYYAGFLYKELGYLYGYQKSRKIALCVANKVGDLKYREVIKKYPPNGPGEIIKKCSVDIVGYSLTK